MAVRYARWALLGCLLAAPLWAVAAEDTLGTAYSAILRGDYETSRAALSRLLDSPDADEARRVQGWLDSYDGLLASRTTLKAKTFAWNVEQARNVLAEGGRTFLALSFATQAAPYAADIEAYGQEPWVEKLAEQSRAEARDQAAAGKWSKALTYYVLLERIYPDDEGLEKLKEEATRHARIELLYKDEEALRDHIADVDERMLQKAVDLIGKLYWEEPDFKKAAEGAIDNLLTLCETTKLYEFLDGLANPALRNHFTTQLRALREEVAGADGYEAGDVKRLFKKIKKASEVSVELPRGLLVVEFLAGADGALDDYTSVIWPSEAKDFDKIMMGAFEGIGIQLGVDEYSNRLKVITPLENSPALEAGLQPDDLIIAVDGESTKGWTTSDAVKNIMGPAGSKVVLTILRPDTGERIPFELTRRNIPLTSVRGVRRIPGDANAWDYMLDREAGVAYIQLTNFMPSSHDELRKALLEAHGQGMQGLVLDVRHNPGGLLDVAVEVVSDFLPRGEIVSTRGRRDGETRQVEPGPTTYRDLPLVVLVNEGSASASEILAGALQDHARAVVLGERTFGKGSVQHVRPLGRHARMKLTTALYYLPSGRTPHKGPDSESWGVSPDWELELTPKEFRRVLERQRDRFVIRNGDEEHGGQELSDAEREKRLAELKAEDEADDDEPPLLSDEEIKLLESDPYEAPDVDPQVETALFLIRVKLAANVPWPRELASAAPRTKQP